MCENLLEKALLRTARTSCYNKLEQLELLELGTITNLETLGSRKHTVCVEVRHLTNTTKATVIYFSMQIFQLHRHQAQYGLRKLIIFPLFYWAWQGVRASIIPVCLQDINKPLGSSGRCPVLLEPYTGPTNTAINPREHLLPQHGQGNVLLTLTPSRMKMTAYLPIRSHASSHVNRCWLFHLKGTPILFRNDRPPSSFPILRRYEHCVRRYLLLKQLFPFSYGVDVLR